MIEIMAGPIRTVLSLSRGGRLNRPSDWQSFERLTRDLYQRLLGDHGTDLHGRSGQPQGGVDVFGTDHRTGQMVGVQCKGRDDPAGQSAGHLSEKELWAEVAKAATFDPPINRYVILTTGANDVGLKAIAREITRIHARDGKFSVEVHAWDWIESHLAEHVDLAAGYGLIAVSQPSVAPSRMSPIAVAIGARLAQAIDLMNVDRPDDDLFTVQRLASLAGYNSWHRLEDILDGVADVGETELSDLAASLGIHFDWLFEGKATPFLPDLDTHTAKVEEIYDAIIQTRPCRLVFARRQDEEHGHYDVAIALKHDDARWEVLPECFPSSDRVGGGGARALFDLCRLIRRLEARWAMDLDLLITGIHLDGDDFQKLIEGEVYPGAVLRRLYNDPWWQDFGGLRPDLVEGDEPPALALRNAIAVVRHQLAAARNSAKRSQHWVDALQWGRFRVQPPPEGAHEPDD